jgi:hypothetical protein
VCLAVWVGTGCEGEQTPPHRAEAAPDAGVVTPAPTPSAEPAPSDIVPEDGDLAVEAPEENPESPTVKLKLDVWPRTSKALVIWGSKKVGVAPLQFERPRHSGPVDVLVKADGYLDYHTRLYTDRDDKLVVRLVRANEAYSLLGFKRLHDGGVPAGDGGARGDGGVAAPVNASSSPDAGGFSIAPSVSF